MKTKSILLLVFVLTNFYSCCTDCEDDGGTRGFSTIYEEKSFPGFLHINAVELLPNEVRSTDNSAEDTATLSTFPNGKLGNFGLRMFVPTDDTVTITAEVGNVFILKADGNHAPAFFDSGTVDEVSDQYSEGIDRQGFTYLFSYPENAPIIDETNLIGFSFEFHFEYKDIATGEILNNKTYEYTVNLQFN